MTNEKVSAVTKYDHIWATEQATIPLGLVLSFPLFVKNDLQLARQEEVRKKKVKAQWSKLYPVSVA